MPFLTGAKITKLLWRRAGLLPGRCDTYPLPASAAKANTARMATFAKISGM
jgi:hypothetical protein